MQKISIFFLLIFSSLQSFCQSGNASKSPEEYVRKSRVQKTIGWAFIAGGTAIAATGAIIQVNDIEKFFNDEEDNPITVYKGAGIFLVGVATALVSIHFFNEASDYSYKARVARKRAKVGFDMKQIHLLQLNGLSYSVQPTLSLKVRL